MGDSRAAKLVIVQKSKSQDAPRIIDEDLLMQSVDDQELVDAGVKPEHLPQSKSVTLSFRALIEIQGLSNLRQLRALRIDNNLIERISGLDALVNLTWLDLSFNQIKIIENLNTLVNLTDLSLYHNEISDLANLDALKSLSVFSIGRNRLKDLKQIEYLRLFKTLRCVCFEGNPIVENENFHAHVYTYLSQLQYLDYQQIDQKTAQTLSETYHAEEISEFKEKELVSSQAERASKERLANLVDLKSNFLDSTFELSDELFANETFQVLVLQGYLPIKDEFAEKTEDAVKSLKAHISETNVQRHKLVASFEGAIKEAQVENDKVSRKLAKEATDAATQQLLLLATTLLESCSEGLDSLESEVQDLTKYIGERGTEFFKTIEELQKLFGNKLHELAVTELEHFAATNNPSALNGAASSDNATSVEGDELLLGSDIMSSELLLDSAEQRSNTEFGGISTKRKSSQTEDAKKVAALSNKDEMLQAVNNLIESQSGIIQAKDDLMQSEIATWTQQFFTQQRDSILQRFQHTVGEIALIR
jgi:hypothetical protein